MTSPLMLRQIRHWFHKPSVRMGPVDNSRIHTTHVKNAQFVSYLTESGFRHVNADRYETSLRRRRLLKRGLLWLLFGGGTWVIIESAKALSTF
jgi:hypothetical protein